jgi:hypothetical protein
MKSNNEVLPWLWKIAVCAGMYVVGTMLGGLLVTVLGLDLPSVPGETGDEFQPILLLAGGLVYAVGLAAMAIGLSGQWWKRWFVLGVFLFVINGIGNSIEASIFTTLGGQAGSVVVFFFSSALCSLAVALLFFAPAGESGTRKLRDFVTFWRPASLAGRVLLALVAFPVIYLFFGGLVSPIVVPYYEELAFLYIPPFSTLLPIAFFRSLLLFVVTLPVIIGWQGSRRGLLIGLALGHAAAVGVGGLVQTTFFPTVLRWTHGVEIFADSVVYAWVLTALFAAFAIRRPEAA